MNRIRLLIADDSPVVREILKDMVEGEHDIELVGEAVNGREAVVLCKELHPDIVTMDVMMPVMNGLEAVEEIMAYCPTPILIFSSVLDDKEMDVAFNAIARGALDVMEKPKVPGITQFNNIRRDLLDKLRMLSRIKVISHLKGKRKRPERPTPAPPITAPARFGRPEPAPVPAPAPAPETPREKVKPDFIEGIEYPDGPVLELPGGRVKRRLVAVGASTGGPKALVQIFRRIPANFPLPVLTVQHIAPSFAPGLVAWLNRESPMRVILAQDRTQPEPGTVYISPTGIHMIYDHGAIRFTDEPPLHSCRPAVDKLFASVASAIGELSVGVLLTGMGHDGAQGLKSIRDRRGITLVQDEKTSVIFGMPRSAIELGAADEILPLAEIAAAMVRAIYR